MIEKVKRIVFNPMHVVMSYEYDELKGLQHLEDLLSANKADDQRHNKNYEIEFLENKIFRIGRLLTFA